MTMIWPDRNGYSFPFINKTISFTTKTYLRLRRDDRLHKNFLPHLFWYCADAGNEYDPLNVLPSQLNHCLTLLPVNPYKNKFHLTRKERMKGDPHILFSTHNSWKPKYRVRWIVGMNGQNTRSSATGTIFCKKNKGFLSMFSNLLFHMSSVIPVFVFL